MYVCVYIILANFYIISMFLFYFYFNEYFWLFCPYFFLPRVRPCASLGHLWSQTVAATAATAHMCFKLHSLAHNCSFMQKGDFFCWWFLGLHYAAACNKSTCVNCTCSRAKITHTHAKKQNKQNTCIYACIWRWTFILHPLLKEKSFLHKNKIKNRWTFFSSIFIF